MYARLLLIQLLDVYDLAPGSSFKCSAKCVSYCAMMNSRRWRDLTSLWNLRTLSINRGVKSDVRWVSSALMVTGSEPQNWLLMDSATCHKISLIRLRQKTALVEGKRSVTKRQSGLATLMPYKPLRSCVYQVLGFSTRMLDGHKLRLLLTC